MIIGVTGNIGSGKSRFSKFLSEALRRISGRDTKIIEADRIVHELLLNEENAGREGSGLLRRLSERFGDEIIAGGKLDRALLAARAFSTADNADAINGIIHPYVVEKTTSLIRDSPKSDFILDVPLLFESNMNEMCDIVVTVTASLEIRRKRAAQFKDFDERDARQWPSEKKEALADQIVANSGSIEELEQSAAVIAEKVLPTA